MRADTAPLGHWICGGFLAKPKRLTKLRGRYLGSTLQKDNRVWHPKGTNLLEPTQQVTYNVRRSKTLANHWLLSQKQFRRSPKTFALAKRSPTTGFCPKNSLAGHPKRSHKQNARQPTGFCPKNSLAGHLKRLHKQNARQLLVAVPNH